MEMKFSRKIPHLTRLSDRDSFLIDMVRGKKVLHGGCVDSGVLEERLATGELLHQRLGKSASHLVGVDVDGEGIRKMQQIGIKDIHHADLETWEYPEKFDYIVLGEIIEHIDNCGQFLKSLKKFSTPETILVFTTPNAYYYLFWLYTLAGKESIHPDHNYLFSFHSIASLFGKFDLQVQKNYVLWENISFRRVSDGAFTKVFKGLASALLTVFQLIRFVAPQYGKSIIVTARFTNWS